jgi:hypothetical protein
MERTRGLGDGLRKEVSIAALADLEMGQSGSFALPWIARVRKLVAVRRISRWWYVIRLFGEMVLRMALKRTRERRVLHGTGCKCNERLLRRGVLWISKKTGPVLSSV